MNSDSFKFGRQLRVITLLTVAILLPACSDDRENNEAINKTEIQEPLFTYDEFCETSESVNFDCACVNKLIFSSARNESQSFLMIGETPKANDMEAKAINELLDLADTVDGNCAGVLTR